MWGEDIRTWWCYSLKLQLLDCLLSWCIGTEAVYCTSSTGRGSAGDQQRYLSRSIIITHSIITLWPTLSRPSGLQKTSYRQICKRNMKEPGFESASSSLNLYSLMISVTVLSQFLLISVLFPAVIIHMSKLSELIKPRISSYQSPQSYAKLCELLFGFGLCLSDSLSLAAKSRRRHLNPLIREKKAS